MKKIFNCFCFCSLLTIVFTFEIKDCSDVDDRQLVVEHHSSIKIGCKHNSPVSSCSISRKGSTKILCSKSECSTSKNILFTRDSSEYICEFELQIADIQEGKTCFCFSIIFRIFVFLS